MRHLIPATLVLVASVASAQDPTAVAREHFSKGTSLFDLGRYKEAAAEYEAAYQAKNDPALLFNIAQTYRLAGENTKAITAYRSYLRHVPKASNREEVKSKIAELQRAQEQQERAKQGPPEGTLRPEEPARKTEATAPAVAPPQPSEPTTGAAPTAPAAEQRRDAGRTKRLAGIGVASGGVALLALGGVFVGLASQANGQVLTSDGRFSASAEDRRDNYQIANVVCFAVGGAAFVTGVVLWVVGRREPRVQPAAMIQPGRVAANVSVSF